MSVNFKLVAKKNSLTNPPEVKYYPCAVSKSEEDLNSLTATISSRSSMSKADCYGVIIALTEAIGEALTDGKIVKIESLGTFQLTIKGTAAETIDELGKANISAAKIIYKPSNDLKKRLKNITYKRIR